MRILKEEPGEFLLNMKLPDGFSQNPINGSDSSIHHYHLRKGGTAVTSAPDQPIRRKPVPELMFWFCLSAAGTFPVQRTTPCSTLTESRCTSLSRSVAPPFASCCSSVSGSGSGSPFCSVFPEPAGHKERLHPASD